MQRIYEAREQETVIEWCEMSESRYPELRRIYHIPNGGKRNAAEAQHLKKQGVKAGVPDLCLPVPKGRYHGLYIEMKVEKNVPTEKQREWLGALDAYGYATAICYSSESAIYVLQKYLKLGSFCANAA